MLKYSVPNISLSYVDDLSASHSSCGAPNNIDPENAFQS